MKDKIQLLKRIRSYMPYHGGAIATNAIYVSPAQALRNSADRIEQEERDLKEFDQLIKDLDSKD